MTKVKAFIYGRRQQRQRRRQPRQQRRGYDNSSPDFRHGELKMSGEIWSDGEIWFFTLTFINGIAETNKLTVRRHDDVINIAKV